MKFCNISSFPDPDPRHHFVHTGKVTSVELPILIWTGELLSVLRINGTVSWDGYFFEGLNILIHTFCACAVGFQGHSKLFHYPIQLLIFICFFEITYKFWKCSSESPFCDWSTFYSADLSSWLQGKCARITCHRLLPVWFYRIIGGFL
jgi:hypothetical protein